MGSGNALTTARLIAALRSAATLKRPLPKNKDDPNELTAWLTGRKGAASCALLGETGSGKTMACLELCRLFFACRTQDFRGMAHEVSLFTESRKSAPNRAAGGKEDRDPVPSALCPLPSAL